MFDWIHANKIATAFILGCIVTGAYTLFVWLDMEGESQTEDESQHERQSEVKHERRSARKSA